MSFWDGTESLEGIGPVEMRVVPGVDSKKSPSLEQLVKERRSAAQQQAAQAQAEQAARQRTEAQQAQEEEVERGRIEAARRPIQKRLADTMRSDAAEAARLCAENGVGFDWVVRRSKDLQPERGILRTLIGGHKPKIYEPEVVGKLISIGATYTRSVTNPAPYKTDFPPTTTKLWIVHGVVLAEDGTLNAFVSSKELPGDEKSVAERTEKDSLVDAIYGSTNNVRFAGYRDTDILKHGPASDSDICPLGVIDLADPEFEAGYLETWREQLIAATGLDEV